MESPILKQIVKFLQTRKKQKQWMVVFVFMAVIVGFGTVTALKMMGQAMTRKEKVLDCQMALHEHTKGCFDKDKNVVCGYADYAVHKHNDDCYNAEHKLICRLPEVEKHEHTKKCYEKTKTLVCGQEESDGHQHGDGCYQTEKGDLKCKKEEHSHSDGCYDEEGNLVCDVEEHQHDDDCYKWEDVLVCGAKEGEGGHKHSDKCYDVQETLVCGKLELHTHTDKCFEKIDKNGKKEPGNLKIVCGKTELKEHTHTEDAGCLRTVDAAEADVIQEKLDKEAEETQPEVSKDGNEIFTTDMNEETEGEASEGAEGEASEDAEAEGEGVEGEVAEGEGVEGEASEDAAAEGEEPETAGDDEQEDAEAEDEEPQGYEESKTYEGLGYIVTASYNKDANIPEEAKFVAERITEESDEEDYKKHEAEYKKSVGNEDATMSALFKIGFYMDGEEVEPASPVSITIQFVDKNGLPEGAPIKVVHFGDETEVIDSSNAESGSTSFKTNGFSKFAIGYDAEDSADSESIPVSGSYKYESDVFDITFHIEGEAAFLEGEKAAPASEKADDQEEGKEEEKDTHVSENSEEESGDKIANEEKQEDTEKTEESKEVEKAKFDFEVKPLDESSDEYKEYAAYAEGLDDKSEVFLVEPISYSLAYDGRELDLSGCKIKAELTPKAALSSYAKSAISNVDSDDEEEREEITEGEENPIQIDVTVIEPSNSGMAKVASAVYWDEDISETDKAAVAPKENEVETSGTDVAQEESADVETNGLVFQLDASSNNAAVTAAGTAYPKFTVQYYANLDSLVTTDNWCDIESRNGYYFKTQNLRALSLIDTSKTTGYGKTPDHGIAYESWTGNNGKKGLKNLALESQSSGKLKVKTEKKLTEVYASKEYYFNQAPNINYFNALNKNKRYELKSIWVLKEGKKTESIDPKDWVAHPYTEDIGFTNRQETADKNSNYICINDKTVMRLVYDVKSDSEKFAGMLYDYDISNGTTTTPSGASKMETYSGGINSVLNPAVTTNQYAFGNKNCGTAYGEVEWVSNRLNMNNAAHGYLGCTFKLAKGITADNNIIFNNANGNSITAPKIFGSEAAPGKTPYPADLGFERKGDTYTLTNVKGTDVEVSNLNLFNNPQCGGTTHKHILTNNFWPLDKVPASKRKDMLFGQNGMQCKQLGSNGALPVADDGENHNCFFGMFYEVEFDLAGGEYTGPLEYLFYGDDDMWVFLDGKLVCDIGGVHSSVGEYVDLWDYLGTTDENGNVIRKVKAGEDKKHTLKFFYTERGASGSSCWMQFTLPSVTSRDPEPPVGQLTNSLTVTKTVDSENYAGIDLEKEYEFKINFKKTDNVPLLDNYGYKKYRMVRKMENNLPVIEDGKPVYEKDSDGKILTVVVQENGLIADGETFRLKDSEYIVIDYLPENTTYTIKEVRDKDDSNYSINTTVDGEKQEGDSSGIVSDKIDSTVESDVEYVNDYSYELPETGGPGLMIYTIAGVICILLGACFMYTKKARERRV